MAEFSYERRRGQLETYFDRTAVEAWKRLTSDAPVSGIRATVRAGRDEMRQTLLGWLPKRLDGCRLLDAGCGTGALACAVARRGASVIGVDISTRLIELARERAEGQTRVDFAVGDMLDPAFGEVDQVVAMDSLIHYDRDDVIPVLSRLAQRTRRTLLFTFAPRTPALALMHRVGQWFPKSDRSPAIVPLGESDLKEAIRAEPTLSDWRIGRTRRVHRGFYTSQALELMRT